MTSISSPTSKKKFTSRHKRCLHLRLVLICKSQPDRCAPSFNLASDESVPVCIYHRKRPSTKIPAYCNRFLFSQISLPPPPLRDEIKNLAMVIELYNNVQEEQGMGCTLCPESLLSVIGPRAKDSAARSGEKARVRSP